MLPHLSPTVRRVPNPGDVLHHESTRDGWSVDPFIVLIEHLESLNPRLLPQHRETLVDDILNRDSPAELGIADIPRSWSSECEKIVTTGQMRAIRYVDSNDSTQLGMSTDPNDPVIDWSSLGWVMEDFHDRSGVLCLRHRDGRCRLVSSGDLHDFDGMRGMEEGVAIPYLVIEEVFWEVKG